MGIRRETAVVLAALGTLAAGASVAAATAWAAWAAGPPLTVEVGEARCLRAADLPVVAAVPKIAAALEDSASDTVRLTVRSATKDNQKHAYVVTVDGEQRASGSVSGGGMSINSVSVADGKSSRVVVATGPTVVFDQTIAGRC
ncbi:hypothetical protein AB0H34_25755 [Saccharopolyspora shandongensis]|uniref:hypothetical protein n=1 Tax=Saccharopolyspora shandongensis TaxID=418495 RepID=UPI0033EF683E